MLPNVTVALRIFLAMSVSAWRLWAQLF